MSGEIKLMCRRIAGRGSLLPALLPARPATAEAAERLWSADNTAYQTSKFDLDAIASGVATAIASNQALSRKQVRDAPWCLWDTTPALASDPAALAALSTAWKTSEKPRAFKNLAASFMRSYGLEQVAREQIAGLLRTLADRWGGQWGELQQRYAIFDLDLGPHKLALDVIDTNRSPAEILRQAGIGDIAAAGGLGKQVVGALLSELSKNSDHELRLSQVERFALRQNGQIQYAGQSPAVIEALVAPFVKQPANVDLQDRFMAVVVKAFGDPRLQPGNWHNLPHKDMILGWLTRQSLRQFLDVVDAITVDRDAKRMWRYRRAFWEGVYEFCRRNNVGVQAWVAFGPEGARKARQVFKEATFAKLEQERKQVLPDHAVLLFRIGDCMIADWNHNGKCNIWSDANERSSPKLFKKSMRYGSDEVRIDGTGNIETRELFSISHNVADTYHWQSKVAERLFRLTGLRIPQVAYKLR